MGSTVDLDKRGISIQEMFGEVAPRYDLLNHLLSGCLDLLWRRKAASALGVASGGEVVDLCCGTGDQALALARRGVRVTAADFCLPMLDLAERKYAKHSSPPRGLAGDSLVLPFRDGSFDGATAAFGVRNVADLDLALRETVRVLRPGGRVAILEFAVPPGRLIRSAYLTYFKRVLPTLGRWVSKQESAYSYLPDSVLDFPQRKEFADRMVRAGLESTAWQDLTGGIVCLYTGAKA